MWGVELAFAMETAVSTSTFPQMPSNPERTERKGGRGNKRIGPQVVRGYHHISDGRGCLSVEEDRSGG